MQKLVHRWLFYGAALLYVVQQSRVHALPPRQYVQMSEGPFSLVFSVLLACSMLYVLCMSFICLAHLVRHRDAHRFLWILFILGLPLIGAYVYLEKHMFPKPPGSDTAVFHPNSPGPAAKAKSWISAAAFVVATVVACTFLVLLSLRVLFEIGDPLLLGSGWANAYEVLLGPGKILFVVGVVLAVITLVHGWPHRGLSKTSLVMYGFVFWAYVGMMWWVQWKPTEVIGIVIVDHGVFHLPANDTSIRITTPRKSTDSVEAKLGTSFGITYVVVGRPAGGKVQCSVLWKFPPPGVRDSASGVYRMSLVDQAIETIGDPASAVYQFKTPEELLLGEWVVQVRDQNGDTGEWRFFVHKPVDDAPSSFDEDSLRGE